jgi:hypothetical protein
VLVATTVLMTPFTVVHHGAVNYDLTRNRQAQSTGGLHREVFSSSPGQWRSLVW